jgi:hypothetical protein
MPVHTDVLEASPGFRQRWPLRALHVFADEAHVAFYAQLADGVSVRSAASVGRLVFGKVMLSDGRIVEHSSALVCGTCGAQVTDKGSLFLDSAWSGLES